MNIANDLVGLAFGLIFFLTGVWQLFIRWRRRRHYHRVPGVIVGRRATRGEVGPAPNTSTSSRAATFRFTTLDGQEIETESNVQSWPGPKPGKRVMVVYDPQSPYDAEPTGGFVFTTGIGVVAVVFGAVVIVASAINLL